MEPEKKVMSRSGDECVVALCDQWYVTNFSYFCFHNRTFELRGRKNGLFRFSPLTYLSFTKFRSLNKLLFKAFD